MDKNTDKVTKHSESIKDSKTQRYEKTVLIVATVLLVAGMSFVFSNPSVVESAIHTWLRLGVYIQIILVAAFFLAKIYKNQGWQFLTCAFSAIVTLSLIAPLSIFLAMVKSGNSVLAIAAALCFVPISIYFSSKSN